MMPGERARAGDRGRAYGPRPPMAKRGEASLWSRRVIFLWFSLWSSYLTEYRDGTNAVAINVSLRKASGSP